MKIVKTFNDKCAMCLGNFDGLHLAHKEIIISCIKYAREKGIKSGVLLFDRHTSEVFGGDTKLLTTMEEKIHILESLGVDFLYIVPFDEEVANCDGVEFIKGVLGDFNISAFFVGFDYAFGKGAKYKAEDLKELGEKLGFSTFITPCMKIDDIAVSSTRIRNLIKNGEVDKASKILGGEYFILSRIKKGFGNGGKFLFKTANLDILENKLIPKDGVYKAVATVSGVKYKSAVNVGKNPTFDAEERTVEAHLIDFSGDLYGQKIKLEFLEKIRDDIKFDSIDKLKKQIEKDIEEVKKERI